MIRSLFVVKPARYGRVLRTACIAALVALGLMTWSLLVPTPMPVIVAMTVAQGLGTLSLAMFLGVVVADARRARWEKSEEAKAADAGAGEPPS